MVSSKNRPSRSAASRAARRRRGRIIQLAAVLLAVGAAVALLSFSTRGGMNASLHQHPHVEIYVQGTAVAIPTDIGINSSLWHDHSMDEYRQMETMSPIHTHDAGGTIHLEMGTWHPCTLGDFFDVWGQPFGPGEVLSYRGPVSLTVDGKPNSEFGDLMLQDGQQIVIRGG